MNGMAKINRLKNYGVEIERKNFYVSEPNSRLEHYIDVMTERLDSDGKLMMAPIVHPIAQTETFIFYICPNCQTIHSESKRSLNIPNQRTFTKCPHFSGYEIQFSNEREPIAFDDVLESQLEKEFHFSTFEFEKETRDKRKGSRQLP